MSADHHHTRRDGADRDAVATTRTGDDKPYALACSRSWVEQGPEHQLTTCKSTLRRQT